MPTKHHNPSHLAELVRVERRGFAAKVRIVRAVLGWSQTELASRAGVTQRAVHKLEQGNTEPRRATVLAFEAAWRSEGIEFEDMADGGFQVCVRAPLLDRHKAPSRQHRLARTQLGITAIARQ